MSLTDVCSASPRVGHRTRLNRLKLSVLLWAILGAIVPVGAHADQRLGALDRASTLWLADDLTSTQLERAWDVSAFQLEGYRAARLDTSGRLWVKDTVYSSLSSWVEVANGVKAFQLEGDRIAVLYTTGTLAVKQGTLNVPLTTQTEVVRKLVEL
jgi:hypothetical protein